MGSWNGTCMISNLPITEGDRIKLIILRNGMSQNLYQGGYVYSNDMLTPSFFPITGIYDDYGGIEKCTEDWNYELIETYFKELFGDEIIVDGETKRTTLINVLEGVNHGGLGYVGKPTREVIDRKALAMKAVEAYSKSGFSSKKIEKDWRELAEIDVSETLRAANISYVMIREDIWNSIVENYKGEFHNKTATGIDDPDFYIDVNKYCEINFNEKVQKLIEIKKLIHEIPDEKIRESMLDKLNADISSGYSLGIFSKPMLDLLTPELYDKIAIYGDDGARDELLTLYTEFTAISSFMSETRKGWMIQPGSGSQHHGWDAHRMLASKIQEICANNMNNGIYSD